MATNQADPVLAPKVATSVTEPPLYKIIYLNDSVTTMDFVIDTLVNIFDYNIETAAKITMDVHEQGSAVVAVLPFEMAEQKTAEVMLYAKANKFPLQTKIEADN